VRTHRILLGPTGELVAVDARPNDLAPTRAARRKPSIAVLPFANMSGDVEQEYFSEGVTEDVITNLSRNRAFFVISRSTSFTYKGPAVDVAKVGAELGVRYVVEGSVRRAANRVRISAQLIDAEAGHHLWADRYDRDLSDVFAVQDEIAQSITGAIAPGIISAEIRHAQQKDPDRLDAWDRIMRAHWHIRRFTQDDLAEARRLLAQAIGLDPSNSTAFSDLAFLRHFQAVFGWGESVSEAHAGAGEAARQAVSLDNDDAAAHTVLAIYEMFSGQHEEARRRLRRAMDLDPNSAFAHGYLGTSHAFAGESDAALPHLDEAIRLSPRDPLLILWYQGKGWAALNAQRYTEAIELEIRAAEANPEFPDIYAVRAAAEGQLDRVEKAQSTLRELLRRMPGLTLADTRLNRPFARAADRERFLAGLRKAGLPDR
jgi:adenylate cyclase